MVFLTLDDGAVADPALISYLKANRVPITTFLTTDYARGNWDYWSQISQLGSVQNHTVSHPHPDEARGERAAEQICQANEEIASHLGKTPWMLRPPYGVYGQSTLAAAGDCGLDYVVHWSVSLPDEEIQYQVGPGFRPGDIILSHYRSDLIPHLGILLAEIKRQGFTVARLGRTTCPQSLSPHGPSRGLPQRLSRLPLASSTDRIVPATRHRFPD